MPDLKAHPLAAYSAGIGLAVIVSFLLLLKVVSVHVPINSRKAAALDFPVYYAAVQLTHQGKSPYNQADYDSAYQAAATFEVKNVPPFIYPPSSLVFLRPFWSSDIGTSARRFEFFLGLSAISIVWSLLFIGYGLKLSPLQTLLVVSVMGLTLLDGVTVVSSFEYGNISIAISGLLLAGIAFLVNGYRYVGLVLLSLGGAIKLIPGIFGLLFLNRKNWMLQLFALGLPFLALMLLEFDQLQPFLNSITQRASPFVVDSQKQAAYLYSLQAWAYQTFNALWPAQLLLILLFLSSLAVGYRIYTLKLENTVLLKATAAAGALAYFLFLLGPLSWMHHIGIYGPVFLIGTVAALRLTSQFEPSSRNSEIVLVASIVVGLPFLMGISLSISTPSHWVRKIASFLPTYSLLASWLLAYGYFFWTTFRHRSAETRRG